MECFLPFLTHTTTLFYDFTLLNREYLFRETSKITKNIAYYLPRNSDPEQLGKLAGPGGPCEVEKNQLNGVVKAWTVYYGELAYLSEEGEGRQQADEEEEAEAYEEAYEEAEEAEDEAGAEAEAEAEEEEADDSCSDD